MRRGIRSSLAQEWQFGYAAENGELSARPGIGTTLCPLGNCLLHTNAHTGITGTHIQDGAWLAPPRCVPCLTVSGQQGWSGRQPGYVNTWITNSAKSNGNVHPIQTLRFFS